MMATSRLLHDTITIFAPTGENNDGVMQYDVYLVKNVYVQTSAATSLDNGGISANDTLVAFIFDGKSAVSKGSAKMAVATAMEAIFYVVRDGTLQISATDKIYVAAYDASSCTSPTSKCLRITKVVRRKAGTQRMWHWEVHAS